MTLAPLLRALVLLLGVFAGGSLSAQDPGTQVLDVFSRRCADCHGSKADPTKKSWKRLSTIDDLAKLRQNLATDGTPYKKKLIDTAKPAASQLLAHSVGADADMPQDDEGDYVELPAAEQAIVKRWFDAGMPLPGKPAAQSQPTPSPRPAFIDDEQWFNTILADLESLPANQRRSARYFTLGHLHNLGAGEQRLGAQRRGLTKLLNSLSWSPRIVRPKELGEGRAILRVLLTDIDWDADKWDRILTVPNNYFVRQGLQQEQRIEQLTGSRMAYVRGDWFVFHAAQPPLYHDLLAPRKQPHALDSDAQLEQYLGIDVAANVREYRAQRAGFVGGKLPNGSGVSDNNRLLERHALTQWQGAYWKSYDFAGSAGDHNLFDNPFGPKSFADLPTEQRTKAFLHDGGEIIWNLPNGMQAYLLVDGKGKRIDQGPPQIVKDRGESGGLGTNIVNGVSCMACHDQGMKRKEDKIREHVVGLTPVSFTRGERQAVERLYPTAEQMSLLFETDSKRFLDAAKAAGVEARDAQQREPVVAAFQDFRNNTVFLADAAFELGMAPELLQRLLGGELASLRQQLETTGIPRDQFLESFQRLARMLRMEVIGGGTVRKPAEATPAKLTAKRGDRLDASIGLALLFVEPGTFQMGSPTGERWSDGDEQQHEVTLTLPYWLGETEVTQGVWQRVMGTTPWLGKLLVREGSDVAVSYVSWYDACEFCRRLTEIERDAQMLPVAFEYRLPSEAEWEFACRAGTRTLFSCGDSRESLKGHAVFKDSNSGEHAHEVKSRQPNPWGYYDLHGNVSEWCLDCKDDYPRGSVSDPLAENGSEKRVVRGGSFGSGMGNCRSSDRSEDYARLEYWNQGFRVVCAPVRK